MTTIIRANDVIINAPLETVWRALIDLTNYPKWNPFTPRVETTFVVGTPAVLYVTLNERRRRVQREIVTAFEPPCALAWASIMGAPFILKANRWQRLASLDAERTQYATYETFDGLLVPLVMALYRQDVQHGFESVGAALKQWAETGASGSGRN